MAWLKLSLSLSPPLPPHTPSLPLIYPLCREAPEIELHFVLCCPVVIKSFKTAIHPAKILQISKSFLNFIIKPAAGIHKWKELWD